MITRDYHLATPAKAGTGLMLEYARKRAGSSWNQELTWRTAPRSDDVNRRLSGRHDQLDSEVRALPTSNALTS